MRLIVVPSLLSLAACSSNMMSDDEDIPVNCAVETRADPFVVNVDATGASAKMDFKLISATPATPMRNENAWVIQVNGMANSVIGAPLASLEIVVTPYMPDHQHGNGIPVTVAAMPDAGQYKLDPLFLGMPGYWEITVDATSSDSSEDQHVYKVCVPN